MRDVEAESDLVFATEEEADAEATRRNRELGAIGSPYYFVAAFAGEGRWRVERHGGPVPLRELVRHALKPWGWGWWPWNH